MKTSYAETSAAAHSHLPPTNQNPKLTADCDLVRYTELGMGLRLESEVRSVLS